jgi:hypothetical protein
VDGARLNPVLIVFAVAAGLIVAGIALMSVSAALIAAGFLLAGFGVFFVIEV